MNPGKNDAVDGGGETMIKARREGSGGVMSRNWGERLGSRGRMESEPQAGAWLVCPSKHSQCTCRGVWK